MHNQDNGFTLPVQRFWQCIYHVRRVCPSASYTSQAIDCKYYTRMQPLYSTVHEAPQSRFHLVRSSTIGFCWLSASVASSQTHCHYRYHIRVCTTKTMAVSLRRSNACWQAVKTCSGRSDKVEVELEGPPRALCCTAAAFWFGICDQCLEKCS